MPPTNPSARKQTSHCNFLATQWLVRATLAAKLPPTNPSPSLSPSDSWNYPVGAAGYLDDDIQQDHSAHAYDDIQHGCGVFHCEFHPSKYFLFSSSRVYFCSFYHPMLLLVLVIVALNSGCISYRQYEIPMGRTFALYLPILIVHQSVSATASNSYGCIVVI